VHLLAPTDAYAAKYDPLVAEASLRLVAMDLAARHGIHAKYWPIEHWAKTLDSAQDKPDTSAAVTTTTTTGTSATAPSAEFVLRMMMRDVWSDRQKVYVYWMAGGEAELKGNPTAAVEAYRTAIRKQGASFVEIVTLCALWADQLATPTTQPAAKRP